jgi:hypothetical protein
MERYIVGVIAGAVAKDFVIAIRALMDFRYLSQVPVLNDNICGMIRASLNEFHLHKQVILDAGARVGKGNREIQNWHIPKLELMQSVEPSIRRAGYLFNGLQTSQSTPISPRSRILLALQTTRNMIPRYAVSWIDVRNVAVSRWPLQLVRQRNLTTTLSQNQMATGSRKARMMQI